MKMRSLLVAFMLVLAGTQGACQSIDFTTKSEPEPSKYALQGNQYAKDGLLREAGQAYRKALVEDPTDALVNRNLGIVYVKTGDYGKAIEHIEKSLKKYDSNFEANFYLAEAQRAKANYGKAIYRYTRALEADENNVKALKSLGFSPCKE